MRESFISSIIVDPYFVLSNFASFLLHSSAIILNLSSRYTSIASCYVTIFYSILKQLIRSSCNFEYEPLLHQAIT